MSSEESDTRPTEGVEAPLDPANEGVLGNPWDRRTFLKAAALGTAAAALWQKGSGLTLSPAAAYANDLSGKPCTGGDVEIVGEGIVLNAPCHIDTDCPGGTFNANVQFTVRNNTSAERYCITLHLNGTQGVPAQDVILRNTATTSVAGAKSGGAAFKDTVMTGTITGVPCNAGEICFGTGGTTRGKCDPGTCTTIAWSTTASGAFGAGCTTTDDNPAGGQCRHQGICIAGFTASLVCHTGCPASCGGSVTLRACAATDPGRFPLTFTLKDEDGNTVGSPQTVNSDADGSVCVDFTFTVSETHTYTVFVADKDTCTRSATAAEIAVNPITVSLGVTGAGTCTSGALVFTATPAGLAEYDFKVDGVSVQKGASNTYNYASDPDSTCHSVSVTAKNAGGCTATATKSVTQCVNSQVAEGACA